MKQRCSSRDRAHCDMYVRNSQGGSESHAAAQEGELQSRVHQLHDAAELPQRDTIGVGKETCYSSFREIFAMPVYPRGLAFV